MDWNLVVAAVGGGVVVAIAEPVVRILDEDGARWIEDRELELGRELERVMLHRLVWSHGEGRPI